MRIGGFAVGAAAFFAGACGVVPSLAVTPRVGPLSVRGEFGASSSGAGTTSLAGLGLDDDPGLIAPRIDGGWLRLDGWASWYDARFAGTGVAQDELDLGGAVLATGEPTDTEFDLLLGTTALTFDVVPGDTFDLGLGFGAAYVDFDARIDSLSSTESLHAAATFGLPLVAAGLSWKDGDDELSVFDGDLMLRWSFLEAGSLQGGLVVGYRRSSVEARYEDGGSDVDASLDLDGPYAGLSFVF